ncbi:MAG: Crp/Fnr family transcriptional regulator [Marinilabiliales bacterium]
MLPESIKQCPVLKDLDMNELINIFNTVHYNIKKFDKDILIMSAGDKCTNLMILINGSVRGEMTDFDGNIVKVEDIKAPKPIAPAFLFGDSNICPVNIIANEFSQIIFIPKEEVIKMMQKNKTILNNYLNIISNRTQFLSQKVRLLSLKSLKKKIAYYYFTNYSNERNTQQNLAEILGVTRPALARALREMEKEGIISFKRGKFKLIDIVKMQKLLK